MNEMKKAILALVILGATLANAGAIRKSAKVVSHPVRHPLKAKKKARHVVAKSGKKAAKSAKHVGTIVF
jgi:hypothetical protein